MRWAELFDEAGRYATDVTAVRETLAERRDE